MKASVTFNAEGAKARIAGILSGRVQFKLDQEVAKDSNFYCPKDVGTLQLSVIPSAVSRKGLLEWKEPYAKAQYYGLPNKSLDANPNARMRWFEHAKTVNLKKWEKVAQEEYDR